MFVTTSPWWIVLVPVEKPPGVAGENRLFDIDYHKAWDAKIVAISGGITVLHPGKGCWISMQGVLYKEDMIPVLISCTEDQMKLISDITAKHYFQLAVMYGKVSNEAYIKHYPENKVYHEAA